ncbi:dihydropteroate synthase [Brevibacillus sp. B_LB10_24]|uniref:dihydropteroate synthase n=1 Tax=Brevibacillus sp. B_LB10_24 TaxID=3380645 RepID=UPI0038B878FD
MKHNPYVIHTGDRSTVVSELKRIGAYPDEIPAAARKGETLMIHLEEVPFETADLFGRKLRDCGGEAVVQVTEAVPGSTAATVLLVATRQQVQDAIAAAGELPFAAAQLGAEIEQLLDEESQLERRTQLVCGSHILPLGQRTLIMGILNVTPDSFSDGGRFNDVERAISHARQLVAEGADMIDIGGESTRPGHEPVGLADELDRILPVVRALAAELSVPLSIDTYKAEVAEQAIKAGAHIINDIWGAKRDPRMASVAADLQVPIILMHNRENVSYRDFFSDLIRDLRESVQIVEKAGVKRENIILDPGIGFAKNLDQNLETMRRLDDIVGLGFPVLLGTSRKSMIGHVLDLPVEERMEGTAATVALGVAKGCHIVRVHDVLEMKRVAGMMDAMLKGGVQNG